MGTSIAKAKQFIVNRILDQAKQEGISLSDIEIRMLGFAEISASEKDLEIAEIFEHEMDDSRYEKKVAELIRRAHQRDKKSGQIEAWDQSLDKLADQDLYLNVMIERSRISGSNKFGNLFDWRLLVGMIPALIVVAVGAFLAFSRTGAKLIPNESIRLLVLVVFLIAPLIGYRIGRKRRS